MIELNLHKEKVFSILSFSIFYLLSDSIIMMEYLISLKKFLEIVDRLVSKIFSLDNSEMIIYLCYN